MNIQDITIVGGGLAGLTAALQLSKSGFSVRLFEQKDYPVHKVCGEYVSNEILTYLDALGANIHTIQPNQVSRFRLYAPSGAYVESQLPLGGFGIRRFAFDHHLYELSVRSGVEFSLNTKVENIDFLGDHFQVKPQGCEPFYSKVVLGCFGKRSLLDKTLNRPFFKKPADYLGLKFYLSGDFPKDLVALYNFDGGYGGAVTVEDGTIDVAFLTRHIHFKQQGSISGFEEKILHKNPAFSALLQQSKRLSPTLTISNISFLPKEQIKQHILLVGDAAGMIPPLAGNGMAMSIHSAKLASDMVTAFLKNKMTRSQMEKNYEFQWRNKFKYRLFWGRRLQNFMGKPLLSEFSVRTLQKIPFILPHIIRQTHGKTIPAFKA